MSNQNQSNEAKSIRKINEINSWISYAFEIPYWGTVLSTKTMKSHLSELTHILEQDFEESKKIKDLRGEILEQARSEADEIIRRAKEQIEKQDLIEQARTYAKQIAEAAYKEAEGIIEEAKQARHAMMVETYAALDSVYSQAHKDVTAEASNTKEYLSESAQNIDISRQKMHADLERISKQYANKE